MVYITVMQSPIYHQMTLEEFLFQNFQAQTILNTNVSNTRTYAYETVSEHFTSRIDTDALIRKLVRFNDQTEALRAQERSTLYETFHIPKKSGGLRRIDAPKPELMNALRNLKTIFEEDFHALYHTSAFAYVKNRCTVDAVKRHQKNNSKWFGKLDLHDFFGSTTLDYVIKMFSMVFPFSEIVKFPNGEAELRKALDLAFLNGGLPQGTPLSPLITNVMMIPVDYKLANAFRDFDKQRFIYTRYADDFIISSKVDFDVHRVEKLVVDTLHEFGAPFTINESKTRYGSSAGRNWNLGVMLNKDNEITVGHKKKRQFQSMLYNYITDKRKSISWPREDVQTMQGLHSYYRMVEPETIDAIVKHTNEKMETDVLRLIKDDLR
jgi:RNA-directed DNA polymerase